MPDVSVRTAWEALLPAGTELLGGEAGVDRPVTWPVVLRTHPPAFDALRGGELAIIPLDRLALLDPSLTLARVITQLARARIGGVCAIGPVDMDAVRAADAAGMPLFRLPEGAHAADVQSSFTRALAEHRVELSNRVGQIGRELSTMAIEGLGRTAIVRRVGQLAGAIAGHEDAEGALSTLYVPPDSPLDRDEAGRRLDNLLARAPEARGIDGHGQLQRLAVDGAGAAVAAPLRGPAGPAGRLVLLAPSRPLAELDAAIVEAGAAAMAIDLAREEAAVAARDELLGDFLDDLVSGHFPSDEAIERRGRNFGHDLSRRHLALALLVERGRLVPVAADDERSLHDAIVAALAEVELVDGPAAVRRSGEAIVVLAPLVEGAVGDLGDDVGRRLSEALADERAQRRVSVGLGGAGSGGRALAQAVARAAQALAVGVRVFGPGHVVAYDDLGLHQLLFGLRQVPEIVAFHRRMLGPLIEHDRRTGGELLRTLDAYLSVGCSPTAAAERLHLHRNGLLYRLQRIREIVPVDLDDPERRLGLHLALRVGDVLDGVQSQIARTA